MVIIAYWDLILAYSSEYQAVISYLMHLKRGLIFAILYAMSNIESNPIIGSTVEETEQELSEQQQLAVAAVRQASTAIFEAVAAQKKPKPDSEAQAKAFVLRRERLAAHAATMASEIAQQPNGMFVIDVAVLAPKLRQEHIPDPTTLALLVALRKANPDVEFAIQMSYAIDSKAANRLFSALSQTSDTARTALEGCSMIINDQLSPDAAAGFDSQYAATTDSGNRLKMYDAGEISPLLDLQKTHSLAVIHSDPRVTLVRKHGDSEPLYASATFMTRVGETALPKYNPSLGEQVPLSALKQYNDTTVEAHMFTGATEGITPAQIYGDTKVELWPGAEDVTEPEPPPPTELTGEAAEKIIQNSIQQFRASRVDNELSEQIRVRKLLEGLRDTYQRVVAPSEKASLTTLFELMSDMFNSFDADRFLAIITGPNTPINTFGLLNLARALRGPLPKDTRPDSVFFDPLGSSNAGTDKKNAIGGRKPDMDGNLYSKYGE